MLVGCGGDSTAAKETSKARSNSNIRSAVFPVPCWWSLATATPSERPLRKRIGQVVVALVELETWRQCLIRPRVKGAVWTLFCRSRFRAHHDAFLSVGGAEDQACEISGTWIQAVGEALAFVGTSVVGRLVSGSIGKSSGVP